MKLRTSGNLFSRSTIQTPDAISTATQSQGRSARPPHQLSPLPKAMGAQTRASAAGLKMCSRSVRTMCLAMTAKAVVRRDQQAKYAVLFEECAATFEAEGHRGRRQAVGGHRRWRDDSDAGQVGHGLLGAAIQHVSAALVVARRAHGSMGEPQRAREQAAIAVRTGVLNADVPRLAGRVAAADVEVATGFDAQIGKGAQRLCRQVDGQTFGDGVQVEYQRSVEADGAGGSIEVHVAKASTRVGGRVRVDALARAVVRVMAELLEGRAESGIEGTGGEVCQFESEADRFKQQLADRDCFAGTMEQSHHFAVRVETRADLLHGFEPRERVVYNGRHFVVRTPGDDLDV